MGRDFAIFRTLGKHHPIRTEQHDSRWLNGKGEQARPWLTFFELMTRLINVILSFCLFSRSQVCERPSDPWEWQPRRWQDLPVLQRERHGWGACREGYSCPDWTALQSEHARLNTHKLTLTNTFMCTQTQTEATHTHIHSHTDIMWNSLCIWKNTWRVSEWLS